MTNLFIREWLNGGLIPLIFFIMAVISYSLYSAYNRHGKGWTKIPGVQSACALLWVFLGELIRTTMAFQILHEVNTGVRGATFYMEPARNAIYVAACIILLFGTLRLVYTLGPKGHWAWVSALVFTVLFVVGLQVFY